MFNYESKIEIGYKNKKILRYLLNLKTNTCVF